MSATTNIRAGSRSGIRYTVMATSVSVIAAVAAITQSFMMWNARGSFVEANIQSERIRSCSQLISAMGTVERQSFRPESLVELQAQIDVAKVVFPPQAFVEVILPLDKKIADLYSTTSSIRTSGPVLAEMKSRVIAICRVMTGAETPSIGDLEGQLRPRKEPEN